MFEDKVAGGRNIGDSERNQTPEARAPVLPAVGHKSPGPCMWLPTWELISTNIKQPIVSAIPDFLALLIEPLSYSLFTHETDTLATPGFQPGSTQPGWCGPPASWAGHPGVHPRH